MLLYLQPLQSAPDLHPPPVIISPFFEVEDLDKLEVTIGKIAAYLEKSGDDEWWMSWLKQARTHTTIKTGQPSGTYYTTGYYMHA